MSGDLAYASAADLAALIARRAASRDAEAAVMRGAAALYETARPWADRCPIPAAA